MVFFLIDRAMKVLPVKHTEVHSDFFDKKEAGIFYLMSTDSESEGILTINLYVHTLVYIFGLSNQVWFSVARFVT